MGIAAAAWHWSPATFWNATPHEYWAAYAIYRVMNKAPEEDGAK